MKKCALILLYITCNIAFAQSNNDSINQTDIEGKRQGRWIVTNKLMKPPLPEYKDDQKVEEGRYSDGKKIGIWTAWYPNGVMKNRLTFENGRPFGKAITYHDNGKIFEEGLWKNNRWIGDYKMYYDNGEVQHDFKFNQSGKRDGIQIYKADNGTEIIKGEMKDGKEVGTWEEHYDNGDLRSEMVFLDGTLDAAKTTNFEQHSPDPLPPVAAPPVPIPTDPGHPHPKPPKRDSVVVAKGEQTNTGIAAKPFTGEGYAKLFRPDKQISKDGEFHLSKLINGKNYIYNRDGILERIAVYQDGRYIGDAPLPTE